MGHAASAFFDTQIGGRQSVHLCWTDGTFGFGVSATREQTTYILSSMAYDIGGLQRAGRFNAANVTVDDLGTTPILSVSLICGLLLKSAEIKIFSEHGGIRIVPWQASGPKEAQVSFGVLDVRFGS